MPMGEQSLNGVGDLGEFRSFYGTKALDDFLKWSFVEHFEIMDTEVFQFPRPATVPEPATDSVKTQGLVPCVMAEA